MSNLSTQNMLFVSTQCGAGFKNLLINRDQSKTYCPIYNQFFPPRGSKIHFLIGNEIGHVQFEIHFWVGKLKKNLPGCEYKKTTFGKKKKNQCLC